MGVLSKADIIKIVKDEGVKFIRLQFTDILGHLKNVAITPSQLDKALDNKCMFDGSSIEGFVRIEESDMYLAPDYDSFVILPWSTDEGKVARLICDVYTPEGKPFMGDPRNALERVLNTAKEMGYTVYIGPELEFFLFQMDCNGKPTLESTDTGGYFDMSPVGQGGSCRRDCCNALEKMGFEIEASHHEVAPAQHEIDFKYGEALSTADNVMTMKLAIKSIAQKHKLWATFMPKPKYGISGSGMHVNISMQKDGVNAFYNENDKLKLSDEAYSFIAGIIKHIKEMVVFTNPLVNSYKRLVPGYEAPVYIAWSGRNRSPLIRIPASSGGSSSRIELRNPDPSCNPYLALAAIIGAGIEGIKNNLKPPHSVDLNIYELTEAERAEKGIDSLPSSLEEAIKAAEGSTIMKEIMGEHIFSKYLEAKKHEWEDYMVRVTPWEQEKYLPKY